MDSRCSLLILFRDVACQKLHQCVLFFKCYIQNVVLLNSTLLVMCDAVAMTTTSAASAPVFIRPDSMRSSRQVSLVVGDSALLRCEALGSPTPEVLWYKDDAILADTAPHPVTWALKLDHVTVEDGGLYTCVVYNHLGAISFSYNVTVRSIIFYKFMLYYKFSSCMSFTHLFHKHNN